MNFRAPRLVIPHAVDQRIMSPMTNLPFNRPLAAFVLLTFCVSVGCSSWRGVLKDNVMSDEAESLVGKRVRLYTDDGVQEMTVYKVDLPYIEGTVSPSATTTIRVDLREVQRVEVYGYSADLTTEVVIVVVLVTGVLVLVGFLYVNSKLKNDPPTVWTSKTQN